MISLKFPVRWRVRPQEVWLLTGDLDDGQVILDVFASEEAAAAEHDRLLPEYKMNGILLDYDVWEVQR